MTRDTIRTARRVIAAAGLFAALACRGSDTQTSAASGNGGAPASRATALPARFALGRPADSAMLAAINIDVNPTGAGLPPGHGSWATGKPLYAAKCAMCHGAKGEGGNGGFYPMLIGAQPRDSFPFAHDVKIPHTIGNYWPYATTLYDYIHRAMPYTAPGSLTPDEVYSVVAYLLAENQVIPRDAVIDATTLPKVKMPAHDHFVPDDRHGGPTFR